MEMDDTTAIAQVCYALMTVITARGSFSITPGAAVTVSAILAPDNQFTSPHQAKPTSEPQLLQIITTGMHQ